MKYILLLNDITDVCNKSSDLIYMNSLYKQEL